MNRPAPRPSCDLHGQLALPLRPRTNSAARTVVRAPVVSRGPVAVPLAVPASRWMRATPWIGGLVAALLAVGIAHGQEAAADFNTQARALVEQQVANLGNAAVTRVEIETGALDPRLKLAPCERVETYLPAGFKAWGKSRVGLRCAQGAVRWNVYLPVTVKVFGPALVAVRPLDAGAEVAEADLRSAEVDLAAATTPAVTELDMLAGRTLLRAVAPGQPLRQGDLRARQWFAAGETVKLIALGRGFEVQGEGQALAAGLDGNLVRVRTETGRVVTGVAVADRRVEVRL